MELDLQWSDHYLVGVDEIDAQHIRLLQIMRNVFELREAESTSPALIKILYELKKYAKFHFKSEEMLMELYEYPDYEEQRAEHQKIYSELKSKLKALKSENDISDLLYFVVHWFVGHTRDHDRAMGRFISESRLGLM
ncbi:MAG: hemerythrin family protein [Proteobacteria bacterium]|nr:hemerythrin family protein [Pseudomonadota bacterium]MBU1688181.1 hemerythrin family protein [Pseudomonadota bacterium]